MLFKGNLRGQASKSYDKISKRLQVCHISVSFLKRVCEFFHVEITSELDICIMFVVG